MGAMSLRAELMEHAEGQLGCRADSPWAENPGYTVLRHPVSGKWVALIMDIPARYIGIESDETIDVVNVKLEPDMVVGLRVQPGYAPAWHMNKQHWLTIRLDGSVDIENVCALMDMSFALVG